MSKILVVDDSSFMRKMLKGILTQAGHEIIGEAGNGEEGVEMYEELHPDVVTLDITMDTMDGIDALKKIRKFDPSAKCIMCSAMGQKVMVTEAIKEGALDFIVKPFQAEKVLESVEKAIQCG